MIPSTTVADPPCRLPQPRCELGAPCVAESGRALWVQEIDRLRAGPLCQEHRRHIEATLEAQPQEQREPDWCGTGEVWMIPTTAARLLCRFRGLPVPGGYRLSRGRV